jgi:hypothetical protein
LDGFAEENFRLDVWVCESLVFGTVSMDYLDGDGERICREKILAAANATMPEFVG